LGVLLYELLTGTTPFQKAQLDEAAFDEQRRIIREKEPPRASVRISSLGETATTVAEHRQTDAKKLHQMVRGDLDWIVAKALEKDRTRRFETASSFAKDIKRFLNDEPVDACPPSTSYRVSKFARRHKAKVVAATVVLLALVVGIGGLFVGLSRARRSAKVALQLLLDRALTTAMSGNLNQAKQAIQDAKAAGAPEYWLEMLRGQVALYGEGNEDRAIRHLKRAVALEGNCVAARAMLAVAYAYGGYEERIDLDKYPPVTAEDCLFLAHARAGPLTDSLELVNKGIELYKSPIAHVVRADIRGHYALDTGDYETAMTAVSEIEGARSVLDDSASKLANEAARESLDKCDFESVFRDQSEVARQITKVVADETNEESLRKIVGPSRIGNLSALFPVGLKYLGNGDNERAQELFRECANNGIFWSWQCPMAKAIVERMENDPNWPSWIESKQDRE
jgi:tetratricopeptide (TPR) repeat protein